MLIFLASNTTFFIILALVAVFMILFFFVVFTALYFFVKRKQRREDEKWANIANQLGLQIQDATTAEPLIGNFNNSPVIISIFGKKKSKSAFGSTMLETYDRVQTIEFTTHCEAAFDNQSNLDFKIISRNYGNIFKRVSDGGSVLPIGFPHFDQNFIVRGGDQKQIHNLLCTKSNDNRTVAERFAAHLNKDWIIEASEGKVAVKMPGKVLDAVRLNAALNVSAELAMRIERVLTK